MSYKRTGADIVIETLIAEGVDTVFGYPGGQVLDIYDSLERNRKKIKHILTSHEQGAAHAADGYARASGKVGVVIATSGPGAANLVTGIATAYLDSSPMVAITGNVDTSKIGRDCFQELDIADITMPITKHNYIVRDVNELGRILREAFAIARSGRRGPVLVDIPRDIQAAKCDAPLPDAIDEKLDDIPSPDMLRSISEAAKMISNAKYPLIYCGGGVVNADAGELVTELSKKIDAPIGCSLMGLSAVSDEFPSKLGLTGMHGLENATKAVCTADVIIAVGTRFTDRATGTKGEFVSNAKIIQLDIDPAEIDKNVRDAAYVIGELKMSLRLLIDALPEAKHENWQEYVARKAIDPQTEFTPYAVIDSVAAKTQDFIVATDVGQHQMWVAQRYPLCIQRGFITSGGLGTMGFGMGAAIGASLAKKQPVVLFTGDGSFGMDMNELSTAVYNNIPLLIILMNNSSLGMVKQSQEMLFKRTSQSRLCRSTDFVKLAEAFGAKGFRASNTAELTLALENSMKYIARKSPIPCLIECLIDPNEKVALCKEQILMPKQGSKGIAK